MKAKHWSVWICALCALLFPQGVFAQAAGLVPPRAKSFAPEGGPRPAPRTAARSAVSPCTGGSVSMSPCDPTRKAPVNSSSSIEIIISNSSGSSGNYFLTTEFAGGVTSASVSEGSITVGAGSFQTVTLSWQLGATMTDGTATLKLSDGADLFLNTVVSVTAEGAFNVDLTYNNNDYQHPGLCEASCFAARAAHSTAPYFSLDSPRSVTLVYDGDRAHPRPYIRADVTKLSGAGTIVWWMLEAKINGVRVTFLNGDDFVYFSPGAEPLRLAAQFDASQYGTGVHTLLLTVWARNTDGIESFKSTTSNMVIVNDGYSYIAKGWAIAGLQHLYTGPGNGQVIVEGGGPAVYFPTLGAAAADFTTLTFANSIYTRTYQDGTRVTFNSSGYHQRTIDRLGREVALGHDDSNRVTRIGDPVRRYDGGQVSHITLTYGANGLSTVTDPGAGHVPGTGRTTTYYVGSNLQLDTIRDPINVLTRFSYDGSGRLWKITDPRGGVQEFTYHSPSWKLSQVIMPQVDVDAGGGSTTTATPTVSFAAWQNVGVPTSATTDASRAAAASRDTIKGTVTDPIGRTTRFTVDRWGQPLVITEPLGRQTTITRSGIFPTSVRHPNAGVDSLAYSSGLLTMSQPAGSAATFFRYGVNAQVDSVWGSGTRVERRFLSASGNVDSVLFAGATNEVVRFTYDTLGRPTRVKDHTGDTVLFAYDPGFGNMRWSRQPAGQVDSTLFDKFGRDSVFGTIMLPQRRIIYDANNRPTSLYDGVNTNPTITHYDELFDTTVVDPKGQIYRFQRNALGWTTREYAANSTSSYRAFRYDRAGQLKSWTNRRGQRVDLTLDSLGRVISKHGANTDTATFSYDPYGFVTVGSSPISLDSIRVDPYSFADSTVRRLVGQRFRIYHTDADGFTQPDSMTVTSTTELTFPTRRFTRNAQTGALASIEIAGLGTTSFSYTTEGDRSVTSYPSSLVRNESYTMRHQRYDAEYNHSDLDDVLRRAYRYDTLGRLSADQRQNGAGTYQRSFWYDGLSRLASVDHRNQVSCNVWPVSGGAPVNDFGWGYTCDLPDSTQTYTYDAAGNRTSQGGTYTDGNQITAFGGGWTFEHDADGNITRKYNSSTGVDRRYHWSAENRLDSVVTVGGNRIGYQYNAFGQPVITRLNGAIDRYFIYDGDNILLDLNANSERTAEYVHLGTDQPFALITGAYDPGALDFFQQDELGNVIGHRRGSTVTQSVAYDTWGRRTVSGSTASQLFWKGLRLETGGGELYHMRARWYDPEIGRFISEDPLGLGAGINQYAFANDDPINGWDPSGRCVLWENRTTLTTTSRGSYVTRISRCIDRGEHSLSGVERRWEPDGNETAVVNETHVSPRTDAPPRAVCSLSVIRATYAVAEDAAALAGYGLAVKAARAARSWGAVSTGIGRELVGYTRTPNNPLNGVSTAMLRHLNPTYVAFLMTAASGNEPSAWDIISGYIPIVNAGLAIRDAYHACK